MKTGNAPKPYKRHHVTAAIRLGILIGLAALVTVPLYTASSSSSPRSGDRGANSEGARQKEPNLAANQSKGISAYGELSNVSRQLPLFSTLILAPQSPAPGIVTYNTGCVAQQSSFVLGDVVCARVTGGITFTRRLTFVDPSGFIRQVTNITSDPQDISFQIPATQTSMVGNDTVDNRGTWRVNMISSRSSVVTSTQFVVTDPAAASADLSVSKLVQTANEQVAAGSSSTFQIYVRNNGPDSAQNVVLIDVVPGNTTFVAMIQTDGPTFSCTTPLVGGTGTVTCTRTSLARGDSATFDFAYDVNAGTPSGTGISNTATVSSDTGDPNSSDNSSTASATVASSGGGGGGTTCSVGCPDDITAQANTTQGGEDGAIVHFSPPSGNDECGPIVTNHCNDCFFPVGITTVTGSAATGESCSFTVTVNAVNSGNPTITCPPNKEANADSNCEATIVLGTPTATGNNVTVVGSRSDGKPMYDCDANGDNCTRKTTDLPFSAGVTTVTWTASTHDIPGPYASPQDEEAHRTGNASCTQTVTVNDVTPPTINAPPQTASADANCQAPVPDYSNTATDNCACSSSDTSENCQGRERIVVTQSMAAGTMVGPGTYTITLTANDGSSNNNGAGNTTTTTTTFTVEDKTAPAIHCPDNITTNTEPGTCAAHVNPGTPTAPDNCDTNPTVTGTRSDGRPLTDTYPGGTTTITWKARDASGNESSCMQTITVEDHEAPTIVCPAPIVQGNDPGTCSATVNPGQPTVTDNCDSHSTVTSTRSDGQAINAPYPKGTTTITWTATDASGNHASCTQTVTVVDNEAPTFTFTGTQTMWPPNHKYHTFPMTGLVTSVHDNCDGNIPVSSAVITKVTSDEIENGNGDGNTLNDIVIAADCRSVQLRSEREGSSNGRVYTIFFSVTDAAGNVGTGTTKVVVQHNPGETAIDSGVHYTVCCHGGTCP